MPFCLIRKSCEEAKPCSCTKPPAFSRHTTTSSLLFATDKMAVISLRKLRAAVALMLPRKLSTKMRLLSASIEFFSCLSSFLSSFFRSFLAFLRLFFDSNEKRRVSAMALYFLFKWVISK